MSTSVSLDDKPFGEGNSSPSLSIAELIVKAKADLTGTGAIIFGVRCDGCDVPPDSLDEVLSRQVADFQQVELISGNPTHIVLDALNDTRIALAETFAKVQLAADDLAKGNMAEGLSVFVDCVATWGKMHEAIIQGGALIGIDFERCVLQGRDILQWLDEIRTKLREIKDAIEARDYVSLGDILRYELDEPLQSWENMLNAFIEHVEELQGVSPCAVSS